MGAGRRGAGGALAAAVAAAALAGAAAGGDYQMAPGETCQEWVLRSTVFDTTGFQPRPLPNEAIPRVAHRWEGNYTQAAFQAMVADRLKWNDFVTVYKIVDGVLYSGPRPWGADSTGFQSYADGFEEQFLMAMWLFGLPDMEFAHTVVDCSKGDPTAPLLSMCIDTREPNAGYAIPMHLHWRNGMSVPQLQAYVACMQETFPPDQKARSLTVRAVPPVG